MNILVIGNAAHLEECTQKFGKQNQYTQKQTHQGAESYFSKSEVIFDFVIDESPEQMEVYRDHPKSTAFLNTTKISLAALSQPFNHEFLCHLFGFAGLPTFLNREILEVSLYKSEQKDHLKHICQQLNSTYLVVDDRVGLVTPRVIAMIINEAYYTVQEKTATREDIDMAMKLGTNYPFGPFEWSQRIGLKHIYELLAALYDDTKDERYKICALLKKEYLKLVTPQ